ncbi:5-(carboxyamino)imidazole ribonucleotide synthase [Egbenema bharatensis]|uniref:5-(carboxyamino)imidazole ribonucleotide synthase n=1 Tax=Egbenema bharatensis TaxID=3463334 RepID=UPI003A8B7176
MVKDSMVQRVGVIGGGQLAWMMAEAAQTLGLELVIQTPKADDPAVSIAAHTIFAPVADASATAELATHCEVITFENEFVDLEALLKLEQQGIRFYPSLRSIAPLLDKYEQRSYLKTLGLPTPEFMALEPDTAPTMINAFGLPVVLKARRLGYDGQGTTIFKTQTDLHNLIHDRLDPSHPFPASTFLLEAFVPFERELAVMVARSVTGELVIYPVVETQQEQQVCRRVIVTPDFDPSIVEQVQAIAQRLLESLDYVGIMGIEFFLTQDGKVLVNETAPRTHNSGHYSLNACLTSQFEQQLRSVAGLPLGDPALSHPGAVMVNLLGYEDAEQDYAEKRQQLAQIPHAHVYWYGKTLSRVGRKLGHVTVTLAEGEGRSQALAIAEQIEAIWYGE